MTENDVNLQIFSLNANGLGDSIKRQAVFSKLKRKGPGIFLLQETHTVKNVEELWYTQWGNGKIFFSHGTSNSAGVAILLSPNMDCEILQEKTDSDGRFIIIDVKICDKIYTIGNLYAPTRNFERQQRQVFQNFQNTLQSLEMENIILGGDFNLYLNPHLDKLDNMPTTNDNAEYRNDILACLETENLTDIWRTLNPLKRSFTFHRGKTKSRLDYFFVSEHFLNSVINTDILPGIHSDHSMLNICLGDNHKNNAGRGFWKFNNSLLTDIQYVQNVKSIIKESISKHDNLEDKRISWEITKFDIRNFTIPFCVNKKKQSTELENSLNKRYIELYADINENYNLDKETEFQNIKRELEFLERQKAKGVILRSKCQWAEEGEKVTSYFLRREKQNYCNKLIAQLSINDVIITDDKEILKHEKDFYNKLLGHDIPLDGQFHINCERFTKLENIPKITDHDRNYCETSILESEILASIKALKNGKSPGSDGFTAEFYKFFWNDIKQALMKSILYSIQHGELSTEQKRGIITLIPKKDKNRIFLKNWRPLTLLNVDYKILAKTLSTRLCKVLPHIINEDQTGYIKGRFIGCNIRQIEDVMIFTELNNTPGIILTIDFEKAFDSINWNFIDKALEAFNFGPIFRGYIRTLYKNIISTIINNGNISEWFSPRRGVRQGCPISPYIFIIAVELLAITIRENPEIKGIDIHDKVLKISQLADDTTCFVSDINSVIKIFEIFKMFQLCAGLAVNKEKTKAKFIGSLKHRVDTPLGLDWSYPFVYSLGVKINGKEKDHYILNYKQRLSNFKNLLNSWKSRKLSLKGKVTVINNLALSPLLYVCSALYTPEIVYTEVKAAITNFLWNNKRAKIAYDVLIQPIEKGGLKLTDFESKVKSLKAVWVKRFIDMSSVRWKAAPHSFYNTSNIKHFFQSNHSHQKFPCLFYQDIHNSWSDVRRVDCLSAKTESITNQFLWNNRYLLISKKPYHWKQWEQNGIYTVNDLLTDDNKFLSHDEIISKYNVRCSFLDILQIRQSIPSDWKQKNFRVNRKIVIDDALFIGNNMVKCDNITTKLIYNIYIQFKEKQPSCIIKWIEEYPNSIHECQDLWASIFRLPFNVSRETFIQSFQYKIIHRLITCQKKLFDMHIVDNANCLYCTGIDTLKHFFLFCPKIASFWKHFFNWWNSLGDIEITPDYDNLEESILFGFQAEGGSFKVLNYCVLMAKYYIYINRIHNNNSVDNYQYLVFLKSKLTIEKNVCSHYYENENSFEMFESLYEQL